MEFNETLDDYVRSSMPGFTDQLVSLVKIPSVSAGNQHRDNMYCVLREAGGIAESYGLEIHIVETPGNPALIASLVSDQEAPTIVVYNHMDVQPAKEAQWETNAFDPVVRNGMIIGRGATDDKGPALTILHAINFLRQNKYPLPNIQVVYETEEEIGSPNFGSFLDSAISSDLLKPADVVIISDTIFEGKHPAITYRLRGLARAELELTLGTGDRHSGIYGGGIENPLNQLILFLSQCVDRTGYVLIPGFYDGIQRPAGTELSELTRVAEEFDIEGFRKESGRTVLSEDDKLELLIKLWCSPTFEAHGFEGVQYEPGIKTAIPYGTKAKVSIRLVPGQDPKDILRKLEDYAHKFDPRIKVTGGGMPAAVTSVDNEYMRLAGKACEYGFGSKPLYIGGGGTIGAVPEFQRAFPEKPIVLIAQSLLSDGYHAPNEHFELSQARKGMRVMAEYFRTLGVMRI